MYQGRQPLVTGLHIQHVLSWQPMEVECWWDGTGVAPNPRAGQYCLVAGYEKPLVGRVAEVRVHTATLMAPAGLWATKWRRGVEQWIVTVDRVAVADRRIRIENLFLLEVGIEAGRVGSSRTVE